MKRAHEASCWDCSLPDELWALILARCDERARWSVVSRAWVALTRHAFWLQFRDEFNRQVDAQPDAHLPANAIDTLPFIEGSSDALMTARLLWMRARRMLFTRTWAPLDLCIGVRIASRVSAWRHKALGEDNAVYPPLMKDIFLLVMTDRDQFLLLDFGTYGEIIVHDRQRRAIPSDPVDVVHRRKTQQAVEYFFLASVVLPCAGEVTYQPAYKSPVSLFSAWHRFIWTNVAPDRAAAYLTERWRSDEAMRAAVLMMQRALRALHQ